MQPHPALPPQRPCLWALLCRSPEAMERHCAECISLAALRYNESGGTTMSALRNCRLISGLLMSMFLASMASAQPPPGGHYQGTYIGGSPGSGHSGDTGIYLGGYSGGYHQGYEGVYQGGYPQLNPPPYGVTPHQ